MESSPHRLGAAAFLAGFVLALVPAAAHTARLSCCDEVAWSPDGHALAFVAGSRVGTVKPDGRDLRFATAAPRTDRVAVRTTPVWSPDSSRVAFAEETHTPEGSDGYWERWRVLSVDRRARGLRTEHPSGRAPSWSADGRYLAVELSDRDCCGRPTGVGIVDRQTGGIRSLDGYSRPRWAPRGSMIAAVRGVSVTYDLHVLRRDGGGNRRLVRIRSSIDDPAFAWSPDGRTLAYAWDSVGTRLALIDLRSGRATRLSAGRVVSGGFAWSPDGRTIAVQAFRADRIDPADCLRLVEVATARIDRLGCRRGLRMPQTTPTWSPDGKFVALPANGGIVIFDVRHRRSRFVAV